MLLTSCPTCVADAPIGVVWSLFEPTRLNEWWDARLRRVTPEGPLSPRQRIEGSTGPLGMFAFTWDVLEVDPVAHRLRLLIRVPFGIRNDETVNLAPLGTNQCRISFG
jgi:hypothetical protein